MTKTYELMTCPLDKTEIEWDETGNHQLVHLSPCGAPLHLTRLLSFDIWADETAQDWEDYNGFSTDAWEVVCENGHTLLTSSGEENAEPFDPAWLIQMKAGRVGV